MTNTLTMARWLMGIRGVLAIIFGIMAFVWPGITALTLVLLFGVYAVFDGVVTLVAAFRNRETNSRWWLNLLEGLVSIAAGVIAFVWPAPTAVALVFIIAFWAVVTGILQIAAAIRLRDEIKGEWALALGGLISIILGAIMLMNPEAGLLGLTWAIAAYAIIFGLLMLYTAITARTPVEGGGARVYTSGGREREDR